MFGCGVARKRKSVFARLAGLARFGMALVLGVGLFTGAGLMEAAPAQAQERLRIIIDEGYQRPLPIAIPEFIQRVEGQGQVGANLAQVITNNLQRSGLFRPLDPRSFLEPINDFNRPPRFQDWRTINADALVTGEMVLAEDGTLEVAFRLYDTLRGEEILGKKYKTDPENWRRIAHLASDAIYERLTGEKGYFDTRVVFISESGPKQRRVKRLAIMDQDGANPEFLSDGADLVLTPRFSPNSQEITYLSYKDNKPRVYLLNVETGQSEIVGDFPGMTFAPRFSPDGSRIIMTLAQGGNSDIYTMDLARKTRQRLTTHPGIDTSPSFSPDGRQITFNSDRAGKQQIYVMNADGSNVVRISQGEGRYATPVWSPRGDLIAFTKILRGVFYIGVMRPDGTGERLLSDGFSVEGPTWAPNGRVIMFFKETPTNNDGSGGTAQIFSIDLTGFNLRRVPTPGNASDPAWSPLIQ